MSGRWRCGRCGPVSQATGSAWRDPRCPQCDGVVARVVDEEPATFACPGCRAAVALDAAACPRCGTRFTVSAKDVAPTVEPLCPSCAVALEARDVGDAQVLACPTCRGLFVDHLVLNGWMRDRASKAPDEDGAAVFAEEGWRVRYHRCPRCVTMMNRVNFASGTGIILDVCVEHGYWLDAGELGRITARVRERGVEGTALCRVDTQRKERRRAAELREAADIGALGALTNDRAVDGVLRAFVRALLGG